MRSELINRHIKFLRDGDLRPMRQDQRRLNVGFAQAVKALKSQRGTGSTRNADDDAPRVHAIEIGHDGSFPHESHVSGGEAPPLESTSLINPTSQALRPTCPYRSP